MRPLLAALSVWLTLARLLPAEPLWVAVGEKGACAFSKNGTQWHAGGNTGETLRSIVYAKGLFIAGGETGIVSSTDGQAWRRLISTPAPVGGIVYGSGRWVAACGKALLRSTDGETFISKAPLEAGNELRSPRLACGDTEAGFRYLVTGLDQKGRFSGVTSDGYQWDRPPSHTPGSAADLAYGAGHFAMVSAEGIATSHDGETWVKRAAPAVGAFQRVAWDGRRFVAAAGEENWISPDGFEWQSAARGAIPPRWHWLRSGVGAIRLQDSQLAFARPGGAWQPTVGVPGKRFHAVAYRE